MLKKLLFLILVIQIFGYTNVFSQNVSLYNQFNGRYDFAFLGNTLNPEENSFMVTPTVLTTSSAILNLAPGDVIESAYLYWAGSGTGDLSVKLNGTSLTPDRTFAYQRISGTVAFDYFSAFKNITSLVQTTGNGTYTLSELDVSAFIDSHYTRRTNFAGWAIIIVYRNSTLPLNQLNIYDGLQAVPDIVNINLNSLNVIDNVDAKIGFLAWEGDVGIAVNESLKINGNTLSNPPLNPADNAFNGTNSTTGATNLYNMDLDIYNIQSNINVGDVSANIQLTSGQDFVMINAIVTKLNSQLPDATIKIDNINQTCDSRNIIVDYTVSNLNSTSFLPAGTYITIYGNGLPITIIQTPVNIPIGEFRNYQITLTIPNSLPLSFELKFVVDDNNGVGTIVETNENNNFFLQQITLWTSPEFNILNDLSICFTASGNKTFDFSGYESLVKKTLTDSVQFFESESDANLNLNPITNTTSYTITTSPKTIYVRIENNFCFKITSFNLIIKSCDLVFYNQFTPNGDGFNDAFFIENLRSEYPFFKLYIYNRWGTLVWQGDKNTPDWDGNSNVGFRVMGENLAVGTYYYVLNVNDLKYPEAKVGWVFLNR